MILNDFNSEYESKPCSPNFQQVPQLLGPDLSLLLCRDSLKSLWQHRQINIPWQSFMGTQLQWQIGMGFYYMSNNSSSQWRVSSCAHWNFDMACFDFLVCVFLFFVCCWKVAKKKQLPYIFFKLQILELKWLSSYIKSSHQNLGGWSYFTTLQTLERILQTIRG